MDSFARSKCEVLFTCDETKHTSMDLPLIPPPTDIVQQATTDETTPSDLRMCIVYGLCTPDGTLVYNGSSVQSREHRLTQHKVHQFAPAKSREISRAKSRVREIARDFACEIARNFAWRKLDTSLNFAQTGHSTGSRRIRTLYWVSRGHLDSYPRTLRHETLSESVSCRTSIPPSVALFGARRRRVGAKGAVAASGQWQRH